MVNEFDGAFDRLQHRLTSVRAASERATAAHELMPTATLHSTPDGTVSVSVTDGRLVSLHVDHDFLRGTHVTAAWQIVVHTINECLEMNQSELLQSLREHSPTMQELEKLVAATRDDFDYAFRSALSKF